MGKRKYRTALTYLGPCHRVVIDGIVLERGVECVVDNEIAERCLVQSTSRRTRSSHHWNSRRVPVELEPEPPSVLEPIPLGSGSDIMSIQEVPPEGAVVFEQEEE